MAHLRPEIDRLSSLYPNAYCQKDMQRLDKLLQQQADFWKKAYGSGDKRALRKEVNYTNQQVYEQLMRDVNRAARQEKGAGWEAEQV